MSISASTLKKNVYKYLDVALEARKPLRVRRNGRTLEIVPVVEGGKFSRLSKHDCIVGDPEAIVHMDWGDEWGNDLP